MKDNLLSAQEIFNRCFSNDVLKLQAGLQSEQIILNSIFDPSKNALKVNIPNINEVMYLNSPVDTPSDLPSIAKDGEMRLVKDNGSGKSSIYYYMNNRWTEYFGDTHNLGWFTSEESLKTTYSTANAGDFAIVVIEDSDDAVYVWDVDANNWVQTNSKGLVQSVYGRLGDVVASQGDYSATLITNDSDVSGDYVSDALNYLNEHKQDNLGFNAVPDTRTVNGYDLSGDIDLTYSDVGAAPSSHNHVISDISDFPSLASVATSGSYTDLSDIPSEFTPSSHNHVISDISDFPVLETVATSGSYNDLLNIPLEFPPESHSHSAADITSGNLDIARMPTGGTWTLSSPLTISNGTITISDSTDTSYSDPTYLASIKTAGGIYSAKKIWANTEIVSNTSVKALTSLIVGSGLIKEFDYKVTITPSDIDFTSSIENDNFSSYIKINGHPFITLLCDESIVPNMNSVSINVNTYINRLFTNKIYTTDFNFSHINNYSIATDWLKISNSDQKLSSCIGHGNNVYFTSQTAYDVGSTPYNGGNIYFRTGSGKNGGYNGSYSFKVGGNDSLNISSYNIVFNNSNQDVDFDIRNLLGDNAYKYDAGLDNHVYNASCKLASGNEIAYALNYTTNKATSGNDTGLLISQTDTASPGTSLILDLQRDSSSVFNIDNSGGILMLGATERLSSISTGNDNNDKLVTQGYVDDVLSSEDLWDRDVDNGILNAKNTGDTLNYNVMPKSGNWNLFETFTISSEESDVNIEFGIPINMKSKNIYWDDTNVRLGEGALANNLDGQNNIANGSYALFNNTVGSDNIANGSYVLYYNTSGSDNIANGSYVLYYNTSGSDNIANGSYVLFNNTVGSDNIANGSYALFNNTVGSDNIANGSYALFNNTVGSDNIAHGNEALFSNTEGTDNIANGYRALYLNTYGSNNIAHGNEALFNNTVGTDNIANGNQALFSNTEGNYNIANGFEALYSNTNGICNIANGYEALYSNTNGICNIANGYEALFNNTVGSYNIAIGFCAGCYENSSYKLFIDSIDRGDEATARTSSLIYGEFATETSSQLLRLNSNVKIKEEFEILGNGNGVILTTPDGTKQFKISIDNNGNIISIPIT